VEGAEAEAVLDFAKTFAIRWFPLCPSDAFLMLAAHPAKEPRRRASFI